MKEVKILFFFYISLSFVLNDIKELLEISTIVIYQMINECFSSAQDLFFFLIKPLFLINNRIHRDIIFANHLQLLFTNVINTRNRRVQHILTRHLAAMRASTPN